MGDNITLYLTETQCECLQDSSGPGWGPVVGCYEWSNRHSESTKKQQVSWSASW